MSQSARFQDTFNMFAAVTGQPLISDAVKDTDIQKLMDLAGKGTKEAAEAAEDLIKDPGLKTKVEKLLRTGNNAASMANLAMTMSNYLPKGLGAQGGMFEAAADMFMGLTGMDRNPALFTPAALQSLSMMGALGTSMIEVDGGRSFAAEAVTAGLTRNLENTLSPFTSTRTLGASRAGSLMNELARSGVLTSGGVDVFGNLKPEDVRKLEESISRQLEGFSEVARIGRRMGLQINEIVPAMQSVYGGRFAEELSNTAGRFSAQMRGDTVGTQALVDQENARRRAANGEDMTEGDRRAFLDAEAQRRAGASMMQQVQKAVQVGMYTGLDTKGSMAVMQTASQLAEDMGLGGEAGIAMGASAMARVAKSRQMGTPMTLDQSLALSRDIMAKGAENPSVQAFASLSLAVGTGVLKEADVSDLMNAFREGKNIDPGEVNRRIAGTGASLSAYTGREAVARGMTMAANDINRFYSMNEDVSVTGAVKAAFRNAGVDPEGLVQKMISGQGGEDIAKAFGFVDKDGNAQMDRLKGMDFMQFTANFNRISSQQGRIDLADQLFNKGAITSKERAQILSNLGMSMDRFGLASDRGSMRTARIRQAEEAERAQYGGMTMVEIRAAAVSENQALISDYVKDQKATMQGRMSSSLKSTRDRKIKERMKAGASESDAAAQVDAEGFSMTDILEAASGFDKDSEGPQMVADIMAGLERDLAEQDKLNTFDSKAKREQLKAQLNDMKSIQAVLAIPDIDQRKAEIDKLVKKQEEDLSAKRAADKANMSPEAKKSAEAQDSQVNTSKTLTSMLELHKSMAETLNKIPSYINTPNWVQTC